MNSGEFKKVSLAAITPFLILLVIGIGWGTTQALLYTKLSAPWLKPESLNIGTIARISLTVASEALLISVLYYCMGKTARRIFSVFIFILCLLTASNLAYSDYFGGIIHLRKISDAYTLTYVWDHLVEHIFNAAFYVQLAASILLLAGLWRLTCLPGSRLTGSFKKRILLVLPFLVLHLALYESQTSRTQMSVSKARFLVGNSTSYFLFGMIPVYSSMLGDVYLDTESGEAVSPLQTTLNAQQKRLSIDPIDPDAVFIIQAESLDASSISLISPTGKPLMPFLQNLREESVVLDKYYLHHNGAASASSELAALLSIVPSKEYNGMLTIEEKNVHSLNHALERNGFSSMFLHSNQGSFFGRKGAYQNMRFQHFLDMQYFKGAAAGFKARDKEFFEQALALITNRCPADAKPFAYMVTMQSHGPFNNYDIGTVKKLEADGFLPGSQSEKIVYDYMCSMRELDESLEHFWESLADGPYKKPLIILYPDHVSGVLDKPSNSIEVGSAMIWSRQLSPQKISAPCSSYDVAPTIMHLLAGDSKWRESDWWIGDTVFTAGPRKAILVNNIIFEGDDSSAEMRPANAAEQEFVIFSLKIQK